MSIARYIQIGKMFFSGNWPNYLILFVTSRCNSRCRMCFNWENIDRSRNRIELTIEEIEKISKGLRCLLYLTVSGGEPTLRDDLPEIINIFTRNNKTQFVTIPTNGLMPERIVSLIDKILYENPKVSFRIVLPLDDVGSLYDNIRGVVGSFDKVIETHNNLIALRKRHKNFDIDVNTVLSGYNRGRLREIIKFVDQNLNVDNHILGLARGNTREIKAKDYSIKDVEEAMRLIEERAICNPYSRRDAGRDMIKALKLRMRDIVLKTLKDKCAVIPCLAGRKVIMIDDIGDLYPCELLDKKMAALRNIDFDMKKALFSPQAKEIKDWIIRSKCFCTFECAMQASVAFNLKEIPALLFKFIKIKKGVN